MSEFDTIFGMDWMARCRALITFKSKRFSTAFHVMRKSHFRAEVEVELGEVASFPSREPGTWS